MSHRIHIIDDFISKEDALAMIDEQNNPSQTKPYPDYYAKRFGGTNFPYNDRIMSLLVKYGHKSNGVHKELNGYVNPIYVFKGFGSKWNNGAHGGLHTDAQDPEPWIEWSTVIYLNDPAEYNGGLIYFPNQDFEYKPRKYSAVFFPSAGTEYVHGITPVTGGDRYTCLYMHTSLPEHADPDFHPDASTETWAAAQHPYNKFD